MGSYGTSPRFCSPLCRYAQRSDTALALQYFASPSLASYESENRGPLPRCKAVHLSACSPPTPPLLRLLASTYFGLYCYPIMFPGISAGSHEELLLGREFCWDQEVQSLEDILLNVSLVLQDALAETWLSRWQPSSCCPGCFVA